MRGERGSKNINNNQSKNVESTKLNRRNLLWLVWSIFWVNRHHVHIALWFVCWVFQNVSLQCHEIKNKIRREKEGREEERLRENEAKMMKKDHINCVTTRPNHVDIVCFRNKGPQGFKMLLLGCEELVLI